jgi:carboxyl-terminal processing protease
MTNRIRNSLIFILLALLTLSSFAAGYFTNEYMRFRHGSPFVAAAESSGQLGLFWEAWGFVENSYLGELPDSTELAYGAIRGALALLNDPYTIFIEPVAREQERMTLRGTFGGIGATLTRPDEESDIILEPIPGNPAEAAGIRSGDRLLAVDGKPVSIAMTVQEVADMIRGEKGTIVVLTVIHPDETEAVDVEIERDDILLPSVTYRLTPEDPTIGYIQLSRFSGESSKEIAEAITVLEVEGAEKLILDLRHNGGGLVDAAVSVSDHFLTEGEVLFQRSRGDGERIYRSSNDTLAPSTPLVVLVDGGTASASEILAGALRDRERALLVGQRTFGKGSVQLVYDLSDGSSVHVTSSRWYTPSRNEIDQQGLLPDFEVEITQEDIDNGRDPILLRAIEVLQEQVASGR